MLQSSRPPLPHDPTPPAVRVSRGMLVAGLILLAPLVAAPQAEALERLCDSAFEDCRAPLRELIRNEAQGIDVAFWFMTDARYAHDLIQRHQAGVPVRVIMDTRATQPGHAEVLQRLQEAGIPMRRKVSSGIVHWKMMLFAGQRVVQFSGANYSAQAFVPIEPWINYVDEAIYFTSRPTLVDSFKRRFDDVWVQESGMVDHANVVGPPVRHYPLFEIDPELNFVPWESFRDRSVAHYAAETQGIDAIIYRITDRAHTDALIAAMARGVRVRILTEQVQYRDPTRLWHAWNVDRLYAAGAEIRHRWHAGLMHQKLTLLHGQRLSIFGSSNWTGPSTTNQLEHNLFTTDPAFYVWSRDQFERKWHNLGPAQETQPFEPLPPHRPMLQQPSHGTTEVPGTVTLAWYAGPWAHRYDVYLGTDPGQLVKVADDLELGPSERVSDWVHWTVSGLEPGATYHWLVVSRTMAGVSRTSDTWTFSVDPRAPAPGSALPPGWLHADVGQPAAAGSAAHSNGRFVVSGAGEDIWGTRDQFHFAYRALSGDARLEARVTSLQGADPWTKAGVMLRATLHDGSAHASMFVTAAQGLAFQRRTGTGRTSAHTSGGDAAAPVWLRLDRRGAEIAAFTSMDGVTWSHVGSASVPMGAVIFAGLAVTSQVPGVPAAATFEHVRVEALPPVAPPPAAPPGEDPPPAAPEPPAPAPPGENPPPAAPDPPAPAPPAPPATPEPAPPAPPPVVSPDGAQRLAVPRTDTWTIPQTPRRPPGGGD